jgi:hypothetical protein
MKCVSREGSRQGRLAVHTDAGSFDCGSLRMTKLDENQR